MAEQGSSFGKKAMKEGVCPPKARSGDIGKVQRCLYSEKIHVTTGFEDGQYYGRK